MTASPLNPSVRIPGSDSVPRVAFQGALGAFSEDAVREHFGESVNPIPLRSFLAVASSVRSGEVQFGLLPIENTLAGSVVGSFDVLAAGGLTVVGEVVRRIRHCLMGLEGGDLAGVRKCLSHPVALAQCGRFFADHPKLEAIAVYDTAGAAKEVQEKCDSSYAAIASASAADHYGLSILERDIQDRDDNQTRFVVVRAEDGSNSGHDSEFHTITPRTTKTAAISRTKIMVLFETRDESGALMKVLRSFADHNINLCKLESRPGTEPWTYRFFAELLASPDQSDHVARAFEDAERYARSFHVLGRFLAKVKPEGI